MLMLMLKICDKLVVISVYGGFKEVMDEQCKGGVVVEVGDWMLINMLQFRVNNKYFEISRQYIL